MKPAELPQGVSVAGQRFFIEVQVVGGWTESCGMGVETIFPDSETGRKVRFVIPEDALLESEARRADVPLASKVEASE